MNQRQRSQAPERSVPLNCEADDNAEIVSNNNFLYVHAQFPNCNVSALLDSGSSVNLMSKRLYDFLSDRSKSKLTPVIDDVIVLANNQEIHITGTAEIQATIQGQQHNIDVYVIKETSHPLLLGTQYMHSHGIKLDFSNKSVQFTNCKVWAKKRITLQPNSETILWGKVPKHANTGYQGVCSGSAYMQKKKLLVSRSLAVVSHDSMVPLKILNPTSQCLTICKGKPLGEFHVIDETYTVHDIGTDKQMTSHCSQASYQARSNKKDANSEFLSHFDLQSNEWSSEEKKKITQLLLDNKALFVTSENPDLGLTNIVEHQIHLKPDAIPKHQRPYKLTPDKREVLRHQLDELLRQGIITPISEKEDIPISSPIVLVSKRNKPKPGVEPGSPEASLSMFRFCVDFRYLNSQTQDFCYAIPDVQELTESFTHRTPNYISSIDLSSGFFQMRISPESAKYTAFNTCFGSYKFSRLPMGLKTSPNSFQLLMDKVLSGISFKSALCYLDDVLIISETFEQHMQDLQEVFHRFKQAGLKLSPQKCKFAQQKCVFLGHEISKDGIRPPSDRLKAISEYPAPKNAKALKRYLGLMNWFKKFIPNYSSIANPLYKLLRKGVKFTWQTEHQISFEKLKEHLLNSEALAFPRYDVPFYLAVDSSSRGIGYMLYQNYSNGDQEDIPRVVRFGSKSLSKWQQSYGPTKLELLGMVTSILDCASYLRGRKFVVECDHQALKPLFQKNLKGAIYERWLAILQEFNFEIRYKKGTEMGVPDALSRVHTQNDPSFSSPDEQDPFFPYVPEHTGKITLPNGGTLQEFLCSDKGSHGLKVVNHMALPHDSGIVLKSDTGSDYDADSEIIDSQGRTKHRLIGKKRANQENHNTYQLSIPSSMTDQTENTDKTLQNVETDHTGIISTTDASQTGSESQQSSFLEDEVKKVELFTKFDFSPLKTKELQRNDGQLHGLINYLETGVLPRSQKKARRILLESSDYALIDGLLWHSRVAKSKRTKQLDHYQLVLPDTMIKTVVQLYHDSPMSGHAGITDTLDRVREHYFFQRMGPLITDYVRSCQECQKRKLTKHYTKSGITAYPQPKQPFEVWQIDLYGPLPPSQSQGFTYVLTCIDMFSRYLVTIPLANKDTLSVASGLIQLFTKYGVCKTLLSDLGTENTSKCMKEVCRQLHIQQEFTPSFVHSCLGMCERSHKTLAERLTPYVNSKCNNWMEVLHSVTFSFNQSVNASTGYSPHEIVFGHRPHFPLTAVKPTDFDTIPVDARTYVRKHAEKLNIIRTEVRNNVIKSQENMLTRANENTNPLQAVSGDYVFLLTETVGAGQKLKNNYVGPFVIDKFSSPHMAVLRNPDTGLCLERPVHLNRLKMAYVREPQPTPYLMSRVATCENGQQTDGQNDIQGLDNRQETSQNANLTSDEQTVDYVVPNLRQSTRARNPPDRFGLVINPDAVISSDDGFIDAHGYHKVKRFLGQRPHKNSTEYLVQLRGEPAESAIWIPYSSLNKKAKDAVSRRPPPVIINVE